MLYFFNHSIMEEFLEEDSSAVSTWDESNVEPAAPNSEYA